MIKSEFYINDYKLKNEVVFNKIIRVLLKHKLSHNIYIQRDYQSDIKRCIIEFDFYQLVNIIDKL